MPTAVPVINALLALDVGERRIGVAAASAIARLPRPVGTVSNDDTVWTQLAAIIATEQPDVVIVGRPLNMSGQETAQTESVRAFMRSFAEHFSVPFVEQDETLTSRQAEDELAARGKQFAKGDIDALAAVYILEDYLRVMERN